MRPVADVAVIGGTGLYALFDDAESLTLTTPYGSPSDAVTVGELAGRRVAFLPRHGADHRHPPHRVPYRANVWALASLGVTRVLAPCAVGSLDHDLPAGAVVVPDQLLDGTHGRPSTFYDDAAVHVPFAEPYCPQLRELVRTAAAGEGVTLRAGGTLAVVPGPRFGTRAESARWRAAGADIVNMTALPEAALAREATLCYVSIAVVTDADAAANAGTGVTQHDVTARFTASLVTVRAVLARTVSGLPARRDCPCARALDGLDVPYRVGQGSGALTRR